MWASHHPPESIGKKTNKGLNVLNEPRRRSNAERPMAKTRVSNSRFPFRFLKCGPNFSSVGNIANSPSSTWGCLRSTTRQQRRHKVCIFHGKKQTLCKPLTCFFHFCTFLSHSRQICDVQWPFLKFYRECQHTGADLNFLPSLWDRTSKFSIMEVPIAFKT